MRFFYSLLLFTTLSLPLVSVLPPLYQTRDEIKAILSDDRLGEKLGSADVIESIKKNDKGYKITTNYHKLQVNVIYLPQARPGPALFDLNFGEARAIK